MMELLLLIKTSEFIAKLTWVLSALKITKS
jgi:hypothetical protein